MADCRTEERRECSIFSGTSYDSLEMAKRPGASHVRARSKGWGAIGVACLVKIA